MIKKIIITLALFSLTALFVMKNNGRKVSGKVVDSNESLAGVKIVLDERVVYTDLDGNFTMEDVARGEHRISFSLISYNTKEVTFNTNSDDFLNIKLKTK